MKLTVSGNTDIGTLRNLNEDAIGMDAENGVFVVADGMGGHSAGEVASALLVDTVLGFFRNVFSSAPAEKIETLIQKSIAVANEKIFSLSGSDSDKMGMGTTAVMLVLRGGRYHAGWVGDSRLYLFRDGNCAQVTHDHSAVQALLEAGVITENQALNHPQRNIITRAVGIESEVSIDIISGEVKEDDLYLLCTDGVSGVLSCGELKKIVSGNGDPGEVSAGLISAANEKSGRDNSSVILVRVGTL